MLRKICSSLALLLAVGVAAAASVDVTKKYLLSNDNAVLKAGSKLEFKLQFECVEGAELGSCKAYVLRKNAPEEFFAKPEVQIRFNDRKNKKPNGYDTIYLTDDKNFPRRMASGEFNVVINTAGMVPGDYAVAVQSWLLKDKKSHYKATLFYLTISEGDGQKFVPTPQVLPAAAMVKAAAKPSWYKNFAVTPAKLEGAAGSKYQVSCDFTPSDKYFFGGYCVKVLRKDAPGAFFERSNLDMRYRFKDKKVDGYDYAILVKFKHMASVPTQKFDFELDTADFPAGDYRIAVEIRLVDRTTGKTAYPSEFFPLKVK